MPSSVWLCRLIASRKLQPPCPSPDPPWSPLTRGFGVRLGRFLLRACVLPFVCLWWMLDWLWLELLECSHRSYQRDGQHLLIDKKPFCLFLCLFFVPRNPQDRTCPREPAAANLFKLCRGKCVWQCVHPLPQLVHLLTCSDVSRQKRSVRSAGSGVFRSFSAVLEKKFILLNDKITCLNLWWHQNQLGWSLFSSSK